MGNGKFLVDFQWNDYASLIWTGKKQLLGKKMQRNEAILYLKALLGSEINISPDSVSIEKQQASKTVKIRIKISNYDRQHIIETAEKRALEIKEETDSIVIYSQ